jgi:hypothetical protein
MPPAEPCKLIGFIQGTLVAWLAKPKLDFAGIRSAVNCHTFIMVSDTAMPAGRRVDVCGFYFEITLVTYPASRNIHISHFNLRMINPCAECMWSSWSNVSDGASHKFQFTNCNRIRQVSPRYFTFEFRSTLVENWLKKTSLKRQNSRRHPNQS